MPIQTRIPKIELYRRFVFDSEDALKKVIKVMDITDFFMPGPAEIQTNPKLEDILDCAVNRGQYAIDMMGRLRTLDKEYILNDYSGFPAYETKTKMYMQDARWRTYELPYGKGVVPGTTTITYGDKPRTYEEAKSFGEALYAPSGSSPWEIEPEIDGYNISGAFVYRSVAPYGGMSVLYSGGQGYWYTLDAPFEGYGQSIPAGAKVVVREPKVHPYFLNVLTHPDEDCDFDLTAALVPIKGDNRLGFGVPHSREAFEHDRYWFRPIPEGVVYSPGGHAVRWHYWLDPAVNAGVVNWTGDANYYDTYGTVGDMSIDTVIIPYSGRGTVYPGLAPIITALGGILAMLPAPNLYNIRLHKKDEEI